jgi:hypothetical protein
MKDVFAIQEDIARRIAQRLKVTFPWSSGEPLVKAATPNLDAYDSYLKARALLYKRGVSIRPALGYYERAVKLDPNYALAWAGLADCYATLGIFGLTPPQQSMPKAIEAARRAVALDSLLAEGHNALAMASLMGAWDRAEAEREFARAMELNPKCTQAFDWYGLFLSPTFQGAVGRGDGASEGGAAIGSRLSFCTRYICSDLSCSRENSGRRRGMRARARREYMPPAPLAVAASAAAREDEAIGHARKAYEIRDPDCQIFLAEYSWLIGYPWFRELVRPH